MYLIRNLTRFNKCKIPLKSLNNEKLFENKLIHKVPITYFNRNYVIPVKNGIYESPFNDCSIPIESTFAQHVMEDFLLYDDLPAITDFTLNKTLTYAELHRDVHKLAKSLYTLGVRWGDVVTILSENRSEFATAFLASSLLGATISTVNHQYTSSELLINFNQSKCKLLFTSDNVIKMSDSVKDVMKSYDFKYGTVIFGDASQLSGSIAYHGLINNKTGSLGDSLNSYLCSLKWNPSKDMLALPFSSGTTGQPKGTMISHFNFVAMVDIVRSAPMLNYEAQKDVLIGVLPFFHIYAQTIVLFSSLKSGSHLVALPKFDPIMFVDAIKKHKPNYLHLVPPIYLLLAKKEIATAEDLASVDAMVTGSAPCSRGLILEVQEKLDIQYMRQGFFKHITLFSRRYCTGVNINYFIGYGLTEMCPVTNVSTWDDTNYDNCGPSIPNTKWKIVHPETHEIIKDIEVEGEICVKGPQMMMGYLNNEKATNETIVDGWLLTGDIGKANKNKELVITDRVKELIKYKGMQIAPAEIEAILIQHSKVADAAVIGVKEDGGNEKPRAYIVVAEGCIQNETLLEDINNFTQNHLAKYKWLRGGIEFIDEIPKSISGKILRRVLIEKLNN